ncbi:MAG: UTP--glucose-1-phosphate uridylyltransferase, partial [Candidatus Omnitrophica bacterium]|nr:UTP--glucose-1-phosphate uridylyltransferase [Candidatus Omnitrophota bacterium]
EQKYSAVRKFLLEQKQDHIFSRWSAPGENVSEKTKFFEGILSQNITLGEGGLKEYLQSLRKELASAKKGENPFQGATPHLPPNVVTFDGFATEAFQNSEQAAIPFAAQSIFVLVAGGIGDRLGGKFDGPKTTIPLALTTEEEYLFLYLDYLSALQKRVHQATGEEATIPLIMMTSAGANGTHENTVRFLADHGFSYGEKYHSNGTLAFIEMRRGDILIQIIQQHAVPAVFDLDARMFMIDPYTYQTKPPGHGDVHRLLHESGLIDYWIEQGKSHAFFFQDTNAQILNAFLPTLYNTVTNGWDMSFITVPRQPGENVGAIVQLVWENQGRVYVCCVEYNQLSPLLKGVYRQKITTALRSVLKERDITITNDELFSQILDEQLAGEQNVHVQSLFSKLNDHFSVKITEDEFISIIREVMLRLNKDMFILDDKVAYSAAVDFLTTAFTVQIVQSFFEKLKITDELKLSEDEYRNLYTMVAMLLFKKISVNEVIDAIEAVTNAILPEEAQKRLREFTQDTFMIDDRSVPLTTNEDGKLQLQIGEIDRRLVDSVKKNILRYLSDRNIIDSIESLQKISRQNLPREWTHYLLNQAIIRASLVNSGDTADPTTNRSPFHGNTNALVFKLDPYNKVLKETNGRAVPPFINPKYDGPEKVEFSPLRSESMMQDIAKRLGPQEIGTTNFSERQEVFSATKNDPTDPKNANKKYSETLAASESAFYLIMRKILSIAGVTIQVESDRPYITRHGVKIDPSAMVTISRHFALTVHEAISKISGGAITPRSVVHIEGKLFKNVNTDGTLHITDPFGVVSLENVNVANAGWERIPVTAGKGKESHLEMRGYEMMHIETARVVNRGTGPLNLTDLTLKGSVEIESDYAGTEPITIDGVLINMHLKIKKDGTIERIPIKDKTETAFISREAWKAIRHAFMFERSI